MTFRYISIYLFAIIKKLCLKRGGFHIDDLLLYIFCTGHH